MVNLDFFLKSQSVCMSDVTKIYRVRSSKVWLKSFNRYFFMVGNINEFALNELK